MYESLAVVVPSLSRVGSLWPHGLQHTSLLHPPISPGVCSSSGPLSRWCSLSITQSLVRPETWQEVTAKWELQWGTNAVTTRSQTWKQRASKREIPQPLPAPTTPVILCLRLLGLNSIWSQLVSKTGWTIYRYQLPSIRAHREEQNLAGGGKDRHCIISV